MSWLSDNLGPVATVGGAIVGGLVGGAPGALAGAGIGAGVGGMFMDQNAANKDAEDTAYKRNVIEADKAWERSQQSAKEQMAFQERMRNTSHQAEVEDLKAAGLNPILSANSGAPMAQGQSATAQAAQAKAPKMENVELQKAQHALGIVSAVQSLQMQKEQMANLRSQTDKNNMDTAIKRKDIPEAEAKSGAWSWLKAKLSEAQNVNAAYERQKIRDQNARRVPIRKPK